MVFCTFQHSASVKAGSGGREAGGFCTDSKLSLLLEMEIYFPSDWESDRMLDSVPLRALHYRFRSCYWNSWVIQQRLPGPVSQSNLILN